MMLRGRSAQVWLLRQTMYRRISSLLLVAGVAGGKRVAPVSVWTYRGRVLEVIPCPDESAEQVSLDIYNAVWPHDTLTMEDVRSFKASVRDHVDYLACIDRAPAGCAVAAIFPQRANRVFTILTVLAGHRRRGAGSALCEAVCAWAACGA